MDPTMLDMIESQIDQRLADQQAAQADNLALMEEAIDKKLGRITGKVEPEMARISDPYISDMGVRGDMTEVVKKVKDRDQQLLILREAGRRYSSTAAMKREMEKPKWYDRVLGAGTIGINPLKAVTGAVDSAQGFMEDIKGADNWADYASAAGHAIGRAATAGTPQWAQQMNRGIWDSENDIVEIIGRGVRGGQFKDWEDQRFYNELKAVRDSSEPFVDPERTWGNFFKRGSGQTGRMAPDVLHSVIAARSGAGTFGVMAYWTGREFFDAYDEFREAGMPDYHARGWALGTAFVMSALEAINPDPLKLTKGGKGHKSIMPGIKQATRKELIKRFGRVVLGAGKEGPGEEAAQQGFKELAKATAPHLYEGMDAPTWDEMTDRLYYATVDSIIPSAAFMVGSAHKTMTGKDQQEALDQWKDGDRAMLWAALTDTPLTRGQLKDLGAPKAVQRGDAKKKKQWTLDTLIEHQDKNPALHGIHDAIATEAMFDPSVRDINRRPGRMGSSTSGPMYRGPLSEQMDRMVYSSSRAWKDPEGEALRKQRDQHVKNALAPLEDQGTRVRRGIFHKQEQVGQPAKQRTRVVTSSDIGMETGDKTRPPTAGEWKRSLKAAEAAEARATKLEEDQRALDLKVSGTVLGVAEALGVDVGTKSKEHIIEDVEAELDTVEAARQEAVEARQEADALAADLPKERGKKLPQSGPLGRVAAEKRKERENTKRRIAYNEKKLAEEQAERERLDAVTERSKESRRKMQGIAGDGPVKQQADRTEVTEPDQMEEQPKDQAPPPDAGDDSPVQRTEETAEEFRARMKQMEEEWLGTLDEDTGEGLTPTAAGVEQAENFNVPMPEEKYASQDQLILGDRPLGEWIDNDLIDLGNRLGIKTEGRPIPKILQAIMEIPMEDVQKHLDAMGRTQQFGKERPGAILGAVSAGVPIDVSGMKGIARKAKSYWQRFFTVPGELTEGTFLKLQKMNSEIAAATRKMEYYAKDLEWAIYKERGGMFGRAVSTGDYLTINSALNGNNTALRHLPIRLRRPLARMRDHLDYMSTDLAGSGMLQGDILATVLGRRGSYLTRSYNVFTDPHHAKTVDEVTRNKAMHEIKKARPGLTQEQYEGLYRKLLYVGKAAQNPAGFLRSQMMAGEKDITALMKRGDLPKWLRELWGEQKDPIINYVGTGLKISQMTAKHKFLESVKEEGLREGWLVEGIPEGQMYEPMAEEGDYTMSPMENVYATPEMVAAFKRAVEPQAWTGILRAYGIVNGYVKWGKTVGSPMTHVRNFFGNAGFALANGHWRVWHAKEMWRGFKADFWSTKKDRDLVLRAIELGLMDEGINQAELKAMTHDVNDFDELIYNAEMRKAKLAKKIYRGSIDVANKFYRLEDTVWKLYGWHNEMDRYRRAHPEWTQAELEEYTAEIVKNTYPTYDRVPEAWRALRQFPLYGTFVSFPAEVIRTSKNSAVLAWKEMQDPKTRSIGIERAAGLATASMFTTALTSFSIWMAALTLQDDEDLREAVPHWQENSQFFHLPRDPDGSPRYVDLKYIDPHSMYKSAFVGAWRPGTAKDKILRSTKELLEPFMAREILTSSLVEVWTNHTEDGYDVYNDQDTLIQQNLDKAAHHWNKLQPGFTQQPTRIYMGAKGIESKFGKRYDGADEAVAMATGLRFQTTDMEQAYRYKARDFAKSVLKAEQVFTDELGRGGHVSAEQVTSKYERMEERRKKHYARAHETYKAFVRQGVDEGVMIRELTRRNMNDDEITMVMTGLYIPYMISDERFEMVYDAKPEEYEERINAYIAAMQRAFDAIEE